MITHWEDLVNRTNPGLDMLQNTPKLWVRLRMSLSEGGFMQDDNIDNPGMTEEGETESGDIRSREDTENI